MKAKILFNNAPDFRFHACHGVWGGIHSRGVQAAFFVDTNLDPSSVDYEIGEQGIIEVARSVSGDAGSMTIARTMNTGIMLSADDAISIGKWLIEQGEAFKLALTGGDATISQPGATQ